MSKFKTKIKIIEDSENIKKDTIIDETNIAKEKHNENAKLTIHYNNDNLDINAINELLDIHIEYILKIKNFIKKNKLKNRLPNFPEIISENLIKE